ncbi:MAG: gliding motility protein GldL [Bacteroidales bacterium]|nr:gliding motility protein GldL [Bacteroidales bacterium]
MKNYRMNEFFESKTYKIITSKVYGVGAAIVIIGCLFKIQHWPGATLALASGLIIESLIFFLSAFEPIHEEVDWTLAYPELSGIDIEEFENQKKVANQRDSRLQRNTSLSSGLDLEKLAGDANLSPKQLEKLKSSILKLGESADRIADLADVSTASSDLSQKLNDASKTTEKFNKSIVLDIEKHENLSEKVGEAAENIGSLGNNYRQLSDEINQSVQLTTSSFDKLNESIQVNYEAYDDLSYNVSSTANHYKNKIIRLNNSIEIADNIDSHEKEMLTNVKQLKEEMKELKFKVSSLNKVYNNMLTAVSKVKTKKAS